MLLTKESSITAPYDTSYWSGLLSLSCKSDRTVAHVGVGIHINSAYACISSRLFKKFVEVLRYPSILSVILRSGIRNIECEKWPDSIVICTFKNLIFTPFSTLNITFWKITPVGEGKVEFNCLVHNIKLWILPIWHRQTCILCRL